MRNCKAKNPATCRFHGFGLARSLSINPNNVIIEKRKINSTFIDHEADIRSLFKVGEDINFEGRDYKILGSFKPHTDTGGEPKTDIFVKIADSTGNHKAIKITYKKSNAEFLENKANEDRAKLILGDNYKSIIEDAAANLQISAREFHNEDKASYVLGYRLDIMSVPAAGYHPADLDSEKLKEIYSGVSIEEGKRNAIVDSERVKDSGVADYIVIGDKFQNAQDVVNSMVNIDDYVETNPKVYIAFKAINYFANDDKWDGNRPLALMVNWSKDVDGKLKGELSHNNVYATTCNPAVDKLKSIL